MLPLLFASVISLFLAHPASATDSAKLTGVLFSNSCLLSSPFEGKICFELAEPYRGKVGIFRETETGAQLVRTKRSNDQGLFQVRLRPGIYRIELLPLRGKRAITSNNALSISDSAEVRLGFRVEKITQ
ncbi:MAG: hypothetical protein K1X83_01995 [Oligoflexia bacterium]|nr:hypothetical protein [Oligoflexia bacterium]